MADAQDSPVAAAHLGTLPEIGRRARRSRAVTDSRRLRALLGFAGCGTVAARPSCLRGGGPWCAVPSGASPITIRSRLPAGGPIRCGMDAVSGLLVPAGAGDTPAVPVKLKAYVALVAIAGVALALGLASRVPPDQLRQHWLVAALFAGCILVGELLVLPIRHRGE